MQASPTVRDHLGPALLHTYAEVNVVEGLDVDKEDFDKYATRSAHPRIGRNPGQPLKKFYSALFSGCVWHGTGMR